MACSGRHVGDCADHHPGLGMAGLIQGYRETKVPQLGCPVIREPDVARLEVTVDHAVRVRMLQRPAHLSRRSLPPAPAAVDAPMLAPAADPGCRPAMSWLTR